MAAQDVETHIRALCEDGDHHAATTATLESYGPTVYSFLAGVLRCPAKVDDVFSQFCENVWRGLPAFKWQCTVRAWSFAVARNAALSHARRSHRQRVRNLPLCTANDVASKLRTATAPYLRTEIKDRFRSLRERLTEEEQTILILRVDKKLPWSEVSVILTSPNLDTAARQKQSARIRKRFQLIKNKLRRWAIDDGLLPSAD